MQTSMQSLRWLMTVPVSILGWYVGIFAGLFIHALGERTCPEQYIVSGGCFAPWSPFVFALAMAVGAAVAACLIVLLPALIAPARRSTVALVALVSGLLFAFCMLVVTRGDAWLVFIVAVLSGTGTWWLVRRRWGDVKPAADHSEE